MEFFLKKSGGKKGCIDVLCVRKSFCSGLGATETHRPTPQIIDYLRDNNCLLCNSYRMRFSDFCANYTKLEICYLGPDSMAEENAVNTMWECQIREGAWKRNISAGGCINDVRKCLCSLKIHACKFGHMLRLFWD